MLFIWPISSIETISAIGLSSLCVHLGLLLAQLGLIAQLDLLSILGLSRLLGLTALFAPFVRLLYYTCAYIISYIYILSIHIHIHTCIHVYT